MIGCEDHQGYWAHCGFCDYNKYQKELQQLSHNIGMFIKIFGSEKKTIEVKKPFKVNVISASYLTKYFVNV